MMNKGLYQLDLFQPSSVNVLYEIKRSIRLALSRSTQSRDQIIDEINRLASQEGIRRNISKSTLDNWCKDSDPDRMPSAVWLTILCKALGDTSPVETMVRSLGCEVIDERGKRLLRWAESELAKRKATRRAKYALGMLEDI